jgi:transcriptional regulator with XRE-family HTH domain
VPDSLKKAAKELATRVRVARQARGLSQEALAHQTGIPYRRYQALEAGTINPTLRTLVRIADALNADVWDLVAGR